LDSESGSGKDEAGGESNVVVRLVATTTPEAELESNSEDENCNALFIYLIIFG